MEYKAIPDYLVVKWQYCVQVDAAAAWEALMDYLSGYKMAVLDHSISFQKEALVDNLHTLWQVALYRSSHADKIYPRD